MKELKKLLPYISKYKKQIIIGLVFVTISNICSTYAPKLVGKSIDKIHNLNFTQYEIFLNVVYLLLLTLGSGLFMFLTRRTIIVSSRLIEYDLRSDYIQKIEKQSMSFFHSNPTGTLMSYVTNDIAATREFLGPAIMYAANALTTFVFAMYFMLNLNISLTFVSLIPMPFIGVATYFLGKKIHLAFKNVQEQFSHLTTQAQETFSGIRIIKSFNREEFENSEFEIKSKEYYRRNLKQARIQALMSPVFIILIGLSQLIILGYGGYLVINNQASLGDLTQFFIYLNLLIWPVAAIGWVTNLVQRAAASAGRLWKIFDYTPEIIDNGNNFNKINGEIEFKQVNFKYNVNLEKVLKNINLKINVGTSLGVLGGVGSGKSTLINLIARLYDVNDGKLLIDGYNIKEYSFEFLRSAIGFVPQDTFLFSMSIKDNIKFGKPDANDDEIIEIAKKVHIFDEIMEFPERFNTILGERGITLSGGQKQRIAIARALIKEPKILILDDALSAVDAVTESKILEELSSLMKDRTTIIVSHRISALKRCDNIIVLDNGEILEQGGHNQLIELKGKYAMINDMQELENELEQIN